MKTIKQAASIIVPIMVNASARPGRSISIRILMSCMFCICVPLQATTLFSTFTSGFGSNTSGGATLEAGIQEVFAVEFSLSHTAIFTGFDFAVSDLGPNDVSNTPPIFNVSLAADANATPGMLLESFLLTGVSMGTEVLSDASVALPTLSAATPYWFIVGSTTTDLAVFWNQSLLPGKGQEAAKLLTSDTNWLTGSGQLNAFDILGTVQNIATPEPSALALASLGIAGLFVLFGGRGRSGTAILLTRKR